MINTTSILMASYTCTPLVLFPLNELKAGVHAKGRTVAELGAGNSPLDMISYEKEGKKYFLMSNSNRPVMRIKYDEIDTAEWLRLKNQLAESQQNLLSLLAQQTDELLEKKIYVNRNHYICVIDFVNMVSE